MSKLVKTARPQYRDEPLNVFDRHWLCPQPDCSGEMLGTGEGFTTMKTKWLNRCDKCGYEEWAEMSFPKIVHKRRSP